MEGLGMNTKNLYIQQISHHTCIQHQERAFKTRQKTTNQHRKLKESPKQGCGPVAIKSRHARRIRGKKKYYEIILDHFSTAFDGLDPITETYIRNMRANGEQINKNPRIKMSTIHAAKGGEADNVLLLQDLTGAALETMSHDPDELHRLFYTGATRAKRELHVLDPKNFDRAYII